MNRKHLIVALVVATLVIVPAVVVASSHDQLDVGSIHTTESDFNAATELTNVSVDGSGAGADIYFGTVPSSYNPLDAEDDGTVDTTNSFVGDTSDDETRAAEVRVTPDESGYIESVSPSLTSPRGSSDGIFVDIYIVQEQPDAVFAEGTLVREDWNPSFSEGFQEIQLDQKYQVTSGQDYTIAFVTQSSDNDGTGDGIRIEAGDDGNSPYSNGYVYDYGPATLTHDAPANFQVGIGVSVPKGRYKSTTHNVEGANEAFADLSLSNAEASVRWEYYDGSAWHAVNSATYTSSGNHSIGVSGHASATQWRANVSFESQSGTTTAELHDEGVQYFNVEPSVDNASASPTGDLTSESDYKIDVSDPTFGLEQGDTVTAELFVDGSSVGTDTLTSNGTATVSHTISDGGAHSYHWEVTDSAGSTTSSQTYSVTVPSTLYIYNESNPRQLIDGTTPVEIRLFGQGDSNTVIQETVSDGTLDLADIPADQRYVITLSADASATDATDYHYRRIVLESIYDQQSVYLLPTDQPSVEVDFSFQDYSGSYPPSETFFYVEKAIRKDFDGDDTDETRYQTIAGDVIGPTGTFPTVLQDEERYRLRIKNRPNQRLLGAFTASRDEIEEITIRGLTLEPPEGSRYAAKREISHGPNGQRLLTFKYRDPAPSNTSALDVWVRYRGNDTIVYEDHVVDVGNYSAYDIPLANDTEYVLEYNATIDGEVESSSIPIGAGSINLQVPLDPDWLGGIVVVGLTFVMALGGRRKWSYIATTVVILAGVVMYLGVAAISPPLWWLSVVIAVGSHLRVMQSPRQ